MLSKLRMLLWKYQNVRTQKLYDLNDVMMAMGIGVLSVILYLEITNWMLP